MKNTSNLSQKLNFQNPCALQHFWRNINFKLFLIFLVSIRVVIMCLLNEDSYLKFLLLQFKSRILWKEIHLNGWSMHFLSFHLFSLRYIVTQCITLPNRRMNERTNEGGKLSSIHIKTKFLSFLRSLAFMYIEKNASNCVLIFVWCLSFVPINPWGK